jgi:hypothetical protein
MYLLLSFYFLLLLLLMCSYVPYVVHCHLVVIRWLFGGHSIVIQLSFNSHSVVSGSVFRVSRFATLNFKRSTAAATATVFLTPSLRPLRFYFCCH